MCIRDSKVTFSKVEQDALSELEADEEATLAKHYGHAEFNDAAKRSFINDVVRGVAKGWETVSANIRAIAQRVAAIVLSAGLVFNALGITDAKAAAYGSMPPPAAVRTPVSYTHLRAHETPEHLVCRL